MKRNIEDFSESLANYLLHDIDGFEMERFISKLLEIQHGAKYESMGGRKDGGADGLLNGLYTKDEKQYIQISREENTEKKIRKTINRLKEVGRSPSSLTYWTHRAVPTRDIIEESLSDELDVHIKIRENNSLIRLINHNEETKNHTNNHFSNKIRELSTRTQSDNGLSKIAGDPTVYTFLKFEVGSRTSKDSLTTPVADALIYWALRDTDPDKNITITRSELIQRIRTAIPGAANLISPKVSGRLDVLSKRTNTESPRIRHYKDGDRFCLPFEMRKQIAQESASDKSLTDQVHESLAKRASDLGCESESNLIATITLDVIYRHFFEQGLILAAFLNKRLDEIEAPEQIIESELIRSLDSESISKSAYSAALTVLRGFFYSPHEHETEFQRRISRTSLLLISLQHSPQLLEYFNKMTGNFRLIIGTDIIVKALSEFFLPSDSKTVTNLLRAAKQAGANLILTEPVMEEVYTHINAVNHEFKNHYAQREQYLSPAVASQSGRILIRAYFYAKGIKKVKSWSGYLNNFLDFDKIAGRPSLAQTELQAFLCKHFNLTHIENSDFKKGTSEERISALKERLHTRNPEKNIALAENDSTLVNCIYAQRKILGETAKYDGYGISTWWFTKETRVLSHTAELVQENGPPYIMRPEFLLNYLTLSPKANLTDEARSLLPTHVGLQLGQHLPDWQMEKLLSAVEEWHDLPQERIEVSISDFADRLKYDRLKQYYGKLDMEDSAIFRTELTALSESLKKEAAKTASGNS